MLCKGVEHSGHLSATWEWVVIVFGVGFGLIPRRGLHPRLALFVKDHQASPCLMLIDPRPWQNPRESSFVRLDDLIKTAQVTSKARVPDFCVAELVSFSISHDCHTHHLKIHVEALLLKVADATFKGLTVTLISWPDAQVIGKISYPPRQMRVDSFRCLFQTIVKPTSVIPDVMQKLDPAKFLNTIQLDGIGSRRTGGN